LEAFGLQDRGSGSRARLDLSTGAAGAVTERQGASMLDDASAGSCINAKAEAPPLARVGFTVTKKTIGHAVRRNRTRRRLKEALRTLGDLPVKPDHDYVVIARPMVLDMPFGDLQATLRQALVKVHEPKKSRQPERKNSAAAPEKAGSPADMTDASASRRPQRRGQKNDATTNGMQGNGGSADGALDIKDTIRDAETRNFRASLGDSDP